MYKVLIIDDERPLREAIRILGDWEGLQVAEVLEATDGKAGLDMLKMHKPDLVMVDMKMPELNGVEFLKIVEREYPDLSTIVISGYDDFEYTRQAIQSKAGDYLLKPVNRHELNRSLRKALDRLKANRELRDEAISRDIAFNMSIPKLKEKIYVSIIERNFKPQSNRACLPFIGADDPDNQFGLFVLRMMNMEAVRDSRFHGDTGLLYFAATNVIDEIARERNSCFSFAHPKREREMIAIFTAKTGAAEELSRRMEYLMRKVITTLSGLLGILSAGGIGQPYPDVTGLADSYETALASVQGIDLLKLKGAAVIGTADRSSAKEIHSFAGRMPLLRGALETGHWSHAYTVLNEFARKIKASGSFSLGSADRTIREIVILFNDMARELGVPADHLPPSGEERALGIATDFAAFDQFEAVLIRILEHYIGQVRRIGATNRPFRAEDIKEYIDNHYFEDIKISMFTDKYFLSREYLMKLFKQQFGLGIHEYVQKVRMDKALELLDDSALKVQDISEMLGYKDKNYFSKAFRNYYALSPSQYRLNKNSSG